MRRNRVDTKIALLETLAEGWSRLSPEHQLQLARHVELVRFTAGTPVGTAGLAGRWCTAVIKGTVATTHPWAVYPAGSSLEHGGETAVVGLEDGTVMTWPSALVGIDGEPLRLYPLLTAAG